MVEKFCSRSHGHLVPGVRRAAMISSKRVMSREGVNVAIAKVLTEPSGVDPIRTGLDRDRKIAPAHEPGALSTNCRDYSAFSGRVASNRNQVRRSASSMKFS